jgi:hypothetical protein
MRFKWSWDQYDSEAAQHLAPFDWTGRWLNRHLQVIALEANTKDGQRQWGIKCHRCRGEYVVTEAQMENPRVVICGCQSRR